MNAQPGDDVIKRFTDVIYKFLQLAKVFVAGMLFQPSLRFEGKARSLPYSEAH